jgi:hypothetical protein
MLDRVLREKIRNIRNLLEAVDSFEAERVEKVKSRLIDSLNSLEGVGIR